MKKILAIVFSIFYFGFSSGAVFRVHYCMEELVSVSQKTDDICSKCGVKAKKDCCKTEIKVLKVDDSQKSDLLKIELLKAIPCFPNNKTLYAGRSFSPGNFLPTSVNPPPDGRSVPIFIEHCNFRI